MDPHQLLEIFENKNIALSNQQQKILSLSLKIAKHTLRKTITIEHIKSAMKTLDVPFHIQCPSSITSTSADGIDNTETSITVQDLFLKNMHSFQKPKYDALLFVEWICIDGAHLGNRVKGWSMKDENRRQSRVEEEKKAITESIVYDNAEGKIHGGFSTKHQLLFNHLIASVVHEDSQRRKEGEQIFKSCEALGQLLPYLSQWVAKLVHFAVLNQRFDRMLSCITVISCLVENPHCDLVPFLSQIIPTIASACVCKDFDDVKGDDMIHLRQKAGQILSKICSQDKTNLLVDQIRKHLWDIILTGGAGDMQQIKNGITQQINFGPRFGALYGIISIGILQGNDLIQPVAHDLIKQWDEESAHNELSNSDKVQYSKLKSIVKQLIDATPPSSSSLSSTTTTITSTI